MCGIVGVIHSQPKGPARHDVYRSLLTLQHRGQDSAGILSFDSELNKFNLYKNLGLVNEVFNEQTLEKLTGQMAIGHTRYSTVGSSEVENIQPLYTCFPRGLGLVHNGNLVNYYSLVEKLSKKYHLQFMTQNDLEIFLNIWSILYIQNSSLEELRTREILKRYAETVVETCIGGYALIGMIANQGMFGIRDPHGIRPLILGKKEVEGHTSYMLSSETHALEFNDYGYVRDIAPGECVYITDKGEIHSFIVSNKEKKSCMFEWVYFSSANSKIDNLSVYKARFQMGVKLGLEIKKNSNIEFDIVSPVPDSGRTSAMALSEVLGIPYREALLKNRYTQRSFILKKQDQREKIVELKLRPIKEEVEGKNILLVDDSIVRGTTSKKIVNLLKKFGAKSVYFASTCPPIKHPCFYGVDFPSSDELIAHKLNTEEVAKEIGAEGVFYLSEQDLVDSIDSNQICKACIDGNYPTDITEAHEFKKYRNIARGEINAY